MSEQVLSTRVSVDKNKSGSSDARRISLPTFSSDSGRDISNYPRASTGSCHDFCKYGKDTIAVRQNRPWIKNTAAAPNVFLSRGVRTVKSAKVTRKNASDKQSLQIRKSEILSQAKMSKESFESSEKDVTPFKEFPTESKLLKEKSLAKKTAATSGSSKSEKLKRVLPSSLDRQIAGKGNGNKRIGKMVIRSSADRKHDTVTKSLTHPPKKANVIIRPPASPSPSKSASKAKTSSSSTPIPLMPIAKSSSHSSSNQLKAKSVGADSPSSSAINKIKTGTLKTPPPVNANIKKNMNIKDPSFKKGEASKVQVSKVMATRCGSIANKYKTATNLKGKELQLERLVDAEIAETKEFHEKKEEEPSHAAELGHQKVMESYDEVPEKTLYIIEMEPGDITKPPSCNEEEVPGHMQLFSSLSPPPVSVAHSSMASSQHEAGQCELTNTDKAPPYAEETPDMQPFASFSPPSPSSIILSNTSSQYEVGQDDSTYTESEVDCLSHEDDNIVDGENLKGADNTKLKKSAAVASQDYSKDLVKLKFRRGRVVDITQENNGPIKLKFRSREHFLDENNAQVEVRRSSFKMTDATQDNATMENSSGTVVLRHQDMQNKKDAQGLFNNVIEETASKLVETRKSKVKALVGAFETVISLQDGKS